MVKWSRVNNSSCAFKCQVGGVMSMCKVKKSICDLDSPCDKFVKRTGVDGIKEFKGNVGADGFLSVLIDDGSPLKNEFLMKIEVATEKLESKKRDLLQDYKEKSYKDFVDDLKEASDDIFDSKGDDISEKDYLENEMSGAFH
jgi:hypothetical protein